MTDDAAVEKARKIVATCLKAERDVLRLATDHAEGEVVRLKAAVEQARQLLAHVVKRLLQPKLDEIMGDWAAADIERVAALTASAPKETVMTDDAAVNAARKLIELWEYEDALEGTHLQPREIARLAKKIAAHTEAALKEKETDRADYEIVVSESSYRTQAEIEDLHAQLAAAKEQRDDALAAHTKAALKETSEALEATAKDAIRFQDENKNLHAELAAAKDRASGLQEFAARQSGEIVTLVGERDALRAAVDQARQALEAARDFIGNGYQPPELIAQIHAALTASAP